MKLAREDYAALERSWITRKIADAAGIFRVPSIEGRELVGRNGSGDYAGLVFPYRLPGSQHVVVAHRLRLDNPTLDIHGKSEHKYLSAPGQRIRLYFPPFTTPEQLSNLSLPAIFCEGEKKTLALQRLALELGNGTGRPAFVPLGLAGVWAWRGVIGKTGDADGNRCDVKGPVPDLDQLAWAGREVSILFDTNVNTNPMVQAARRELARELARRGATVRLADLPPVAGINGPDDYLAAFGAAKLSEILKTSRTYDWRSELLKSNRDKVLPVLANAIAALRFAPEWANVLAWDEFGLKVAPLSAAPWGPVTVWTDQEDRRTTEWLQRKGIMVKLTEAGQAVQTVARDISFHPVREYLNGLKWDGISRIDDWLTLYCGAESRDLTRAIAARWLISGVARVYQPGSKADCVLVLEGPQGIGKSRSLKTLGGEWFCDGLGDLGNLKESALNTRSKWIIELSELDSLARADNSRIKSFVSRPTDHFRLPYDKRAADYPRECIFAGSINADTYLKDESGARRFWPVCCGRMQPDLLARDRDQLWAEAVVRYRRGDPWWLDSQELAAAAESEQGDRYDEDVWHPLVAAYVDSLEDTSVGDVLRNPIGKPKEHWTQADKNRIARILITLKWKKYRKRLGTALEWRYRPIGCS